MQYYSNTNIIIILYTTLDLRRRFNYFIKKKFPEEQINETKEQIYYILESQYLKLTTSISDISIFFLKINTLYSQVKSRLDEDFENDNKENTDKIHIYITEKPINKDIDILVQWKVDQI